MGTLSGVWISDNDGDTWAASNIGIPASSMLVTALFVNAPKIYAGTQDGVFVSADNGVNWHPLGTLPSGSLVQAFTVFQGKLFVGLYAKGVRSHAL